MRGAYRSFAFPREIGTEARFGESQLPQASASHPGQAARRLQEVCGVSGLLSPLGRLAR
jgi:hypothetical protein